MADNTTPLEPPDSHFVRAAEGWLELGCPDESEAELERVAPASRGHPDVLHVQWLLCARSKQWVDCVTIACAALELDPGRTDAWVHRSFALHELKRTQEALECLAPAAERFPEVWVIPYNLACYCAQLGRLGESRDWLQKALTIDEDTVKEVAARDPDLKPLWDSLAEDEE